MDPVVHFEMGYHNRERMRQFYQTVFGWQTQEMGPEMGHYVTATTAKTNKNGMVETPGAINGGFYQKTQDQLSHAPSIVISVKDIQAAIKAVKKQGGKILGSMDQSGKNIMEPQTIPGIGLWISIKDTEDNRVSLLQPLKK
jgi:uncharacterized protein